MRFTTFLREMKSIWATFGKWLEEALGDDKYVPAPVPPPEKLLFDTPKHAYHAVRVMCDKAGLSLEEKNVICAVIYQESQFDNNAVCKNKNTAGVVTSTDVGICQINSYWHTGPGKQFPSTEYVVAHPEEAVKFMLNMQKTGKLHLWVGFTSKKYKYWLMSNSPMWLLKS